MSKPKVKSVKPTGVLVYDLDSILKSDEGRKHLEGLDKWRKTEAPLVVIHVEGGVVQHVDCPDGVCYEVLDYDNCRKCGGVECEGGHVQPCPSDA